MKIFLWAISILALMGVFVEAQAQSQRNPSVFHRVQVRVLLPDGTPFPSSIKVQLGYDRSGQPLELKTLLRDNSVEFTRVTNGDYVLQVTADENVFEPHSERFTLRSNFPLLRQISVFLRKKMVFKENTVGTVAVPGTPDASLVFEIPKDARKAFDKGIEKVEKGKIEDAIKAFQDALKHHPNYIEAINNLAVQYIKLGRYGEAVTQLNRAVKLDPQAALPRLNLGIALNEQKLYKEAIDELSQAVRLDFENPVAHYQLGLAFYNTSEFMRAQIEFEITVESAASKIPVARLYLADVYKRVSRPGDAIKQLEIFLRETSNNPFTDVARKELEKLKQEQQ